MKLHLHVYRETVWPFESAEAPGRVCVLRHGVHSLQPCFVNLNKRTYLLSYFMCCCSITAALI
jgi:hypothetical protein